MAHQSIQTVEAITLLLFGFYAQRLSPSRSFAGRLASLMASSAPAFSVLGWSPIPIVASPLRAHAKAPWGLSNFPERSGAAYVFASFLAAFCPEPMPGISQPAHPNFPCALSPLTPRAPALLANVSSRRMAGFSSSGSLANLPLCNEADSVRLRYGSQVRSTESPTRRLLPALSASHFT